MQENNSQHMDDEIDLLDLIKKTIRLTVNTISTHSKGILLGGLLFALGAVLYTYINYPFFTSKAVYSIKNLSAEELNPLIEPIQTYVKEKKWDLLAELLGKDTDAVKKLKKIKIDYKNHLLSENDNQKHLPPDILYVYVEAKDLALCTSVQSFLKSYIDTSAYVSFLKKMKEDEIKQHIVMLNKNIARLSDMEQRIGAMLEKNEKALPFMMPVEFTDLYPNLSTLNKEKVTLELNLALLNDNIKQISYTKYQEQGNYLFNTFIAFLVGLLCSFFFFIMSRVYRKIS